MRSPSRQRLTDLLPPLGAGLAGVLVLATVLLVPSAWLESLSWRSGLSQLLPMAEPPLGATARGVLALGGGAAAAAIAWAALFLLWGTDGLLVPRRTTPGARHADAHPPSVRRADAHPDAPPRPPLTAAELGEPLPPPPPAEQPIPADLDQPLAAFDPAAIPDVPREPVRPVAPLVAPRLVPELAAGERIETFDLSPRAPGDTQPSIEQLLRRLELGAGRRPAAAR